MTLRPYLVLGRVSNLPTVWTNALAGAVLAGVGLSAVTLAVLILTLSLFYVGGMYLNDAFDAEIDARERPGRPIPSGQVAQGTVWSLGLAFLGVGTALSFLLGVGVGIAGAALAASVVLYDWLHKRTALAPLLMGLCRFLSYVMAALAAGAVTELALIGAVGLFAHTIGLTYAARQEAYDRIDRAWPLAVLALPVVVGIGLSLLPGADGTALLLLAVYAGWTGWQLRFLFRRRAGDVPRAVVGLIAGIALYDAALIAMMGASWLAAVAVAGFAATLLLQRIAPGT